MDELDRFELLVYGALLFLIVFSALRGDVK